MLGRAASFTRRSGVTLLLTLLLLAIIGLVLARQISAAATVRLGSAAHAFSVEAQLAAEGVARQWLARSQDSSVPWSELLATSTWDLAGLRVSIHPSSAEDKLCVTTNDSTRWLAAWRQRDPDLLLVEDPQRTLSESSFVAIEALLDRRYASCRIAYIRRGRTPALADMLTVWGQGKIDVNRAAPEVLAGAIEGLTGAQVSKLLRLRQAEPIESLHVLPDELGLSAAQAQKLQQIGTLRPRHIELVIDVQRGPMQAVYRAAIDSEEPGRLLELRFVP